MKCFNTIWMSEKSEKSRMELEAAKYKTAMYFFA